MNKKLSKIKINLHFNNYSPDFLLTILFLKQGLCYDDQVQEILYSIKCKD